jgi:hypothetical protein
VSAPARTCLPLTRNDDRGFPRRRRAALRHDDRCARRRHSAALRHDHRRSLRRPRFDNCFFFIRNAGTEQQKRRKQQQQFLTHRTSMFEWEHGTGAKVIPGRSGHSPRARCTDVQMERGSRTEPHLQVQSDFFRSRFNETGELMLFASGMPSRTSNAAIQSRMKRLSAEFSELHHQDLDLPLSERLGTSVLVALRPWLPDLQTAKTWNCETAVSWRRTVRDLPRSSARIGLFVRDTDCGDMGAIMRNQLPRRCLAAIGLPNSAPRMSQSRDAHLLRSSSSFSAADAASRKAQRVRGG